VNIGTVQNLNYGNVGGDQTAAATQSFYQTHMAAHGVTYWALHILVALIAGLMATAVWEHFLK
jgi:hypothetical protein